MFENSVLDLLNKKFSVQLNLLDDSEGSLNSPSDFVTYCDLIYSLWYLDFLLKPTRKSVNNFFDCFYACSRWGAIGIDHAVELNAHQTAYCLGALRLLRKSFPVYFEKKNAPDDWDFSPYLDTYSIPRYPLIYRFHAWRSSHWLGGGLSIMLNAHLETGNPKYRNQFHVTMNSIEHRVLDTRGLIRHMNPKFLGWIFRYLYNFKHDSRCGEVGGVAHLTWIYHYEGKAYKECESLLNYTWAVLNDKSDYVEDVPYCLDFDFVQIIRTASEQLSESEKYVVRMERYAKDVERYIVEMALDDDMFDLHKLPGALATYFECLALVDKTIKKDVIKEAAWL